MRSSNAAQQKYRERKIHAGYKRVQIWKLDETNDEVKKKIKNACRIIGLSDEKEISQVMYEYYDQILQDIPL